MKNNIIRVNSFEIYKLIVIIVRVKKEDENHICF
jgi:hypothetical protein